MFHALLWKEWRESWLAPLGALLYVGVCFVFLPRGRRIDPEIWQIAFAMGLFAAALYIPIHLYAREKGSDTAGFIFSKPLDRFRLWWFSLIIGLTVFFAVGLILYGTITALSHFYVKVSSYEARRISVLWTSIYVSAFIFCLTSLISSFFKRQIPALVGTMLILFISWVAWTVASMQSEPFKAITDFLSQNQIYSASFFLTLCPFLLLVSLVAFAHGNVRRQTRTRVIACYSVLAIAAFLLSAGGVVYLSGGIREALKSSYEKIGISDMSRDGNRLLLSIDPGDLLVSVDITQHRANILDKGIYGGQLNHNGNAIVYLKEQWSFPFTTSLMLADFRGESKKTLLRNPLGSLSSFSFPLWSTDYLGIVAGGNSILGRRGFVSIYDAAGHLMGESKFPWLETGEFVYPVGWDSISRFYYFRSIDKRGTSVTTFWRVRPDNVAPEQIPYLSERGERNVHFSADGKWITYTKQLSRNESALWLHAIDKGTGFLVSRHMLDSCWSKDGAHLAYLESLGTNNRNDAGAPPPRRIVFYEPETGETTSFSLVKFPEVDDIDSWSYSGEYLLMGTHVHYKSLVIFLLRERKFEKIMKLSNKSMPRWIEGDRLLWTMGKKLVITGPDGLNPQEIFRVEGNKFYFYGEEQH